MPKFVIERSIPQVGSLGDSDYSDIATKSCKVLASMGPRIQWLHSYITDDKIFCVYIADNAETVRKHAEQGGFPADNICEVKRMIDPTTANAEELIGV
jgi:hypothetical protein